MHLPSSLTYQADRLPWMVAIALYIRGEVTEAVIQMVFDIDCLLGFITSFIYEVEYRTINNGQRKSTLQ
jgi:hypothetical protein